MHCQAQAAAAEHVQMSPSGAILDNLVIGGGPDLFTRRLRHQLRPGMSRAKLLARTLVTGAGRSLTPITLSLFPLPSVG
jgi:hypothetical protein